MHHGRSHRRRAVRAATVQVGRHRVAREGLALQGDAFGRAAMGEGSAMNRRDILGERLGWGNQVSGGNMGPDVTVTTAADSGAGSLRAACEAEGPAFITFAQPFDIKLSKPIRPKSNKTVD